MTCAAKASFEPGVGEKRRKQTEKHRETNNKKIQRLQLF